MRVQDSTIMEGIHLEPAHRAERPLEFNELRRVRSHEHVDGKKRHAQTQID
jgi:hypothetical protein